MAQQRRQVFQRLIGSGSVLEVVLVAVSVLVALISCEGAYRIYLAWNLEKLTPFGAAETSTKFSFGGYPALWKFDKDVGWTFSPDGYIAGDVENGRFMHCGRIDQFNVRGHVASVETDWDAAEVRGALVGSSYTMGPDETGRLFHETLGDMLSRRSGRSVLVENFSRDSYGVIQMFDLAAVVAERHKPDFLVVSFNSATISMDRHWRKVTTAGDGFYDFFMMPRPDIDKPTPQTAFLHEYIVNDGVTSEWCERMNAAATQGDEAVLRNDPVVRALVARNDSFADRRSKPRIVIDFWSLTMSFVLRRILHGNAFWNMTIFESVDNPLKPLSIDDFGADGKFLGSLRRLEESRVPYVIVYIPSYPEVLTGQHLAALGWAGTKTEREHALVASLTRRTKKPVHSLLKVIGAPRADAAAFAEQAEGPNQNWHPNRRGVTLFAGAMVELLMSTLLAGKDRVDVRGTADGQPRQ